MNECSICLEDILDNTSIIKLKCNHKYHVNCFTKYIESIEEYNSDDEELEDTVKKYITCPYCREKIDDIEPIEFEKDISEESTLTDSDIDNLEEFRNLGYPRLFHDLGASEIIGDNFICLNEQNEYKIIYYDEDEGYICETYPYTNETSLENLMTDFSNIIVDRIHHQTYLYYD